MLLIIAVAFFFLQPIAEVNCDSLMICTTIIQNFKEIITRDEKSAFDFFNNDIIRDFQTKDLSQLLPYSSGIKMRRMSLDVPKTTFKVQMFREGHTNLTHLLLFLLTLHTL